jgi:hypothetical protein
MIQQIAFKAVRGAVRKLRLVVKDVVDPNAFGTRLKLTLDPHRHESQATAVTKSEWRSLWDIWKFGHGYPDGENERHPSSLSCHACLLSDPICV